MSHPRYHVATINQCFDCKNTLFSIKNHFSIIFFSPQSTARMWKFSNHMCDTLLEIVLLLPHPSHFREAAFVAHHEEGGRVVAAHEVVKIERLPNDEAGAVEGVAGLELGVLALHHHETSLAEMTQQHAAVGRPRDAQKTFRWDLIGIERTAEHKVGGFARLVVVGEEVVPVLETHTAGEYGKRGEAGGVVTLHITPDALEGGHAEGFLATLLDHAREKLEISGSLHLARDGFLHHFAKSQYVCFVRLHNNE